MDKKEFFKIDTTVYNDYPYTSAVKLYVPRSPVDWEKDFSKETFDYIKDNAVIYDEIYRHTKSLHYSLNKEELILAYERMKSWNKSFILIIEDGESNWFYFNNQDKIHELCEQTGVPEDKIVYITNDVECDVVYDRWFINQSKYKTKINFINHPTILMQNKTDTKPRYKNYYKIERYKDRSKLPTKKFMCLMGHQSRQRDFIWNFFENKDIKEDGYISYLHKKVVLLNSNINMDKLTATAYGSDPSSDRLREYFKDSYFSIVPEAEGGAPLGEKTHKPLLHGHPFILLSYNETTEECATGVLDRLKEWGFETFPELFDESYDEISNVDERRNNFKQQILRLCDMETKELLKLCESVVDKCIHNQKIASSLKLPNEQLISKLESLKNG